MNLLLFSPIYTPISVEINSSTCHIKQTQAFSKLVNHLTDDHKGETQDHFFSHRDLQLQQLCGHSSFPLEPPDK